MSFLLADCKELDFGELLAVNGGCSGGGSCSGGYSGGGSSGPTGPRGSDGGTGGAIGGTSGAGSNGSSSGCSGGIVLPQSPSPVRNNCGGSVSVPKNKPDENPGENTTKSLNQDEEDVTKKIKDAIDNFGDNSGGKGEKKKAYKVGEFQCDDYVEQILTDAGLNPKNYYVDDASGKTVDTHISELTAAGADKYSTDVAGLEDGAYVVFMKDADGAVNSHAAILVVDSDGGSYMYDNSSHNFPYLENGTKKYEGGIEKTVGTDAKAICDQYVGYDDFYFQKIM